VQEGMIATIHGGGTATAMARGAPYMMAGKTGTAQKISRKGSQSFDPHSLPYHLRHQALFVGYAPADNPTIAIAISVEHGGFGGTAAAPIARKVFDTWLLGKMPEPVEGVTRSPQGGVLMDERVPPPAVQSTSPTATLPPSASGIRVGDEGAAQAATPPTSNAAGSAGTQVSNQTGKRQPQRSAEKQPQKQPENQPPQNPPEPTR
jgi:penicillin-binding protein 2